MDERILTIIVFFSRNAWAMATIPGNGRAFYFTYSIFD
jgi:hypothetical protein